MIKSYSKYCLEKFGAVLHHNIDKLYIGAGWNTNSFGSVKRIKTIKIVVNGRISNTCNGEKININQMMEETIKEYVGTVLPHLNVEKDLDKAQKVIAHDDVIDDFFEEVKQELIELIRNHADEGEQAVDLLMVTKYFERIGDHATNIAEWVIFSITGQIAG